MEALTPWRIGRLGPTDPATIGQYRVLGVLGEGAMGQVYLGTSPGQRLVAVKTVGTSSTDST